MKRQLEDLVMLQELDSLLEELSGAETRRLEEGLGFPLGEMNRLRDRRAEIADGLHAEILRHYERVRRRHPRAVVPTSQGVCMGCFTRRPTSMATRSKSFETCERCGRILYRLDEVERPTGSQSVKESVAETSRTKPQMKQSHHRERT